MTVSGRHRGGRWLLALLLAGFAPLALPHDIGVTQAELIEIEVGRYSLSAAVSDASAYLHGSPRLPARCAFEGNPRGVRSAGGRSWTFSCAGGLTADDALELPWRRDAAMLSARWQSGTEARRLFGYENGRIEVPLAELQAGSGGWPTAARRYAYLGVEHILLGVDHLLFVLGLMLLVAGPLPLIKTITAFTVAHSITLGLATSGLLTLPAKPVEAAIALSIVFLALEILQARRGHLSLASRKPWLVAFGFGLLHGLGFAGALAALGLPAAEIPMGLAFFNIGVELGQLAFVAVMLAGRWLLDRALPAPPAFVALVPVYLIGTVATYWVMERIGTMVSLA